MIGQVWLYFDEESKKTRPGVVVAGNFDTERDVTICKISTQTPYNEYDYEIPRWEEQGLKKPSYVRCSKMQTLHSQHLKVKVAQIEPEIMQEVKETISRYILK